MSRKRDPGFPLFVGERSPLLTRDLDLLVDIRRSSWTGVVLSTSGLDATLKRTFEPRSPGVKRRVDVVGIFPDADVVLRLVGSVLIEIHDECQAERRYFSLGSMTELREPQNFLPVRTDPLRLAPIH